MKVGGRALNNKKNQQHSINEEQKHIQNNDQVIGYDPSESNISSPSQKSKFEISSIDEQGRMINGYYSSGFESNIESNKIQKQKVKSWKKWKMDYVEEEDQEYQDQQAIIEVQNQDQVDNFYENSSSKIMTRGSRGAYKGQDNNMEEEKNYQSYMDSTIQTNLNRKLKKNTQLQPIKGKYQTSLSILKNTQLSQVSFGKSKKSVQFNQDSIHSYNEELKESQNSNSNFLNNHSSYQSHQIQQNYIIRQSQSSKNFQQTHYSFQQFYNEFYLDDGNLIEENENEYNFEYLDGSTYCGVFPRDNYSEGIYAKKYKLNQSYYMNYKGPWLDGLPHGENGIMELDLRNWPKYHAITVNAQNQNIDSIKLQGSFINGQPDGEKNLNIDKQQNQQIILQTSYHRGLEIPISKELKDINLDKALLNFSFFILIVALIIIGINVDFRVLYAAGGLYIVQILEHCCSQTRQILQNQDNLETVKNLLSEYQKWRPAVFLHYSDSNQQNKKQPKLLKNQKNLSSQSIKQQDKSEISQQLKYTLSNEQSIDYATIIDLQKKSMGSLKKDSELEISSDAQQSQKQSIDLIDEFKYYQWQDFSPQVDALNDLNKYLCGKKLIKLNIYKLFDFSTKAQYKLLKRRKVFLQFVYVKSKYIANKSRRIIKQRIYNKHYKSKYELKNWLKFI
eukprot:403372979